MSKAVFKSKLAPLIRLFIQTKQSRDLPYLVGERILMEFDRMIAEFFPDEATVTKEIVLSVAEALILICTSTRRFEKYRRSGS